MYKSINWKENFYGYLNKICLTSCQQRAVSDYISENELTAPKATVRDTTPLAIPKVETRAL